MQSFTGKPAYSIAAHSSSKPSAVDDQTLAESLTAASRIDLVKATELAEGVL